jgi:hypothetical protein
MLSCDLLEDDLLEDDLLEYDLRTDTSPNVPSRALSPLSVIAI